MDSRRPIDQILAAIAKLDRSERLELLWRLWEDLLARGAALGVSERERAVIDERLAAYEAARDDTLSWDEVEACVLAELGRKAR